MQSRRTFSFKTAFIKNENSDIDNFVLFPTPFFPLRSLTKKQTIFQLFCVRFSMLVKYLQYNHFSFGNFSLCDPANRLFHHSFTRLFYLCRPVTVVLNLFLSAGPMAMEKFSGNSESFSGHPKVPWHSG